MTNTKKGPVMRTNLDNHQAFLTRKLDHYNAWLMDPNRDLRTSGPYPGFPEEVVKSEKKRTERRSAIPTHLVIPTKKVKRVRVAKGQPTKQEQALRLVELNPKKEEAIYAIMTQLNMSKAGATTYFYNAKKILGVK